MFILIGVVVGIFVAGVVGPVFDLSKPIIGAIAAGSAGILGYWWWIFNEARKKRKMKKNKSLDLYGNKLLSKTH